MFIFYFIFFTVFLNYFRTCLIENVSYAYFIQKYFKTILNKQQLQKQTWT